ncbi:hypothetical protein NUACC21_52320 [Scytonema sp. NUACC21]
MKKLLFICSRNRLRSPTAEAVFCEYEGLEVESAGLDSEAEIPLCSESIQWADIIFVLGTGRTRARNCNLIPTHLYPLLLFIR